MWRVATRMCGCRGMTEQEIKLREEEGLWTSGVLERSPKEKLFYMLYQGPVKTQSVNEKEEKE